MGRGGQGQDTRTTSHSVKATKEMRQLKFTGTGNDRNSTQRKDARNKQKLAINIVLERSVTLAFKIGPEKKRCLSVWSGRSKVNLLAECTDLSPGSRSFLESQHNIELSFALFPAWMLNPFQCSFYPLVSMVWKMHI